MTYQLCPQTLALVLIRLCRISRQATRQYYYDIAAQRKELLLHLVAALDRVVFETENTMIIYIIVFAIVLLCCLFL